jgi:hypothetical protein
MMYVRHGDALLDIICLYSETLPKLGVRCSVNDHGRVVIYLQTPVCFEVIFANPTTAGSEFAMDPAIR